MTSRTRFLILWVTFALEALAIAIWASWNTPVTDIALIFGFIFGVPLSLVLAVLCRRKRLLFTIGLGIPLIGCSAIVFGGNPLVIAAFVLLIAVALWLFVPNAPKGDGYKTCTRCGYPLVGLPGRTCPECGDDPRNKDRGGAGNKK